MDVMERIRAARLRLRDNPLAGPLGRRLLTWFLVLSLIPLFLSNMLGYLESQELIEGLVERNIEAVVETQLQHVEDRIERSLLDLQAIAAGNEFLAAGAIRMGGGSAGPMGEVADRAGLERHLSRKLRELSQFRTLLLQRPDGSVAASAGEAPPDLSLWTHPAPVPAFESLEMSSSRGGARFRLSVPVEGPDGALVGYLGAIVGQEELVAFLDIPEHLAGSIESFIVDGRGRPVFVSHPHGPIHYTQPLETPLLKAPPGTFARYIDRDGVEVIGTILPLRGRSWSYVAEFPVAEALGPLRALRRLSLLLGGAFGVGVIVTAWIVAGGVVAPIGRLVEATRRVGRGDLDASVEIEREDEIGELGRAFNEMTTDLSDASARVRELHQREIERAGQLATVGELASGVAHEIKNPVVGISGGLDLIRRRLEDDDDEELAAIMEEVTRQLARIEMAVRDLLSFARPATPTLSPARAREIAERAVRLVQPGAERAGVLLELEANPGIPELRVDAELVGQALVNLLMNAIHATPEGGVIHVSIEARDGEASFRVSDTGRGIPEENLEAIFKPFFTTRHSGSGLGLPITRDIVERHGGRVEVESRAAGSTFTIILPVSDASGIRAERRAARPA